MSAPATNMGGRWRRSRDAAENERKFAAIERVSCVCCQRGSLPPNCLGVDLVAELQIEATCGVRTSSLALFHCSQRQRGTVSSLPSYLAAAKPPHVFFFVQGSAKETLSLKTARLQPQAQTITQPPMCTLQRQKFVAAVLELRK